MSSTLLLEMAAYNEKDVFSMNPVASISTENVLNLEGKGFKKYVLDAAQEIETPYLINMQSVGEIYSHHCVGRNKRKAAMTVLPVILRQLYTFRHKLPPSIYNFSIGVTAFFLPYADK